MDRRVRTYLGPSPYIESRHPKIRALARQLTAEPDGAKQESGEPDSTEPDSAETESAEPASAWEKVEAIYDWVRENVEYKKMPLKGAVRALRDGDGDCEELASLFIAICRASAIPARTVWVPNHCYAEFYLEDEEGTGHWFPCQVAGNRAFGEMPDHRPILQKGDNFPSPRTRRDRMR